MIEYDPCEETQALWSEPFQHAILAAWTAITEKAFMNLSSCFSISRVDGIDLDEPDEECDPETVSMVFKPHYSFDLPVSLLPEGYGRISISNKLVMVFKPVEMGSRRVCSVECTFLISVAMFDKGGLMLHPQDFYFNQSGLVALDEYTGLDIGRFFLEHPGIDENEHPRLYTESVLDPNHYAAGGPLMVFTHWFIWDTDKKGLLSGLEIPYRLFNTMECTRSSLIHFCVAGGAPYDEFKRLFSKGIQA